MHELTRCEQMIMRVVWSQTDPISTSKLLAILKEDGKEYARTTVVTFLQRLITKGFVTTERIGRSSYVTASKSKEDYLRGYVQEFTAFWFDGDTERLNELL